MEMRGIHGRRGIWELGIRVYSGKDLYNLGLCHSRKKTAKGSPLENGESWGPLVLSLVKSWSSFIPADLLLL